MYSLPDTNSSIPLNFRRRSKNLEFWPFTLANFRRGNLVDGSSYKPGDCCVMGYSSSSFQWAITHLIQMIHCDTRREIAATEFFDKSYIKHFVALDRSNFMSKGSLKRALRVVQEGTIAGFLVRSIGEKIDAHFSRGLDFSHDGFFVSGNFPR